jgi:predicted permease
VSKSAAEGDLDEELAFHLEMETRKNLDAGMSEEEARRRARLAFGGVERFKEEVRDARWVSFLENVWADIRYAGRSLLRRPGFALAAILTIALGIGGTTAIFGVVDALFLRYPAGVAEPGEVVQILVRRDEGAIQNGKAASAGSYVDYETLRSGTHAFSELAATLGRVWAMDLGRGVEAEQIHAGIVSQTYFPLLGVRPALGRLFLPEEDNIGGSPVAVVSHTFWQQRMGADPKALGRILLLNDHPVTVVGVMEREFTGLGAEPVDVWVPTATAPLLTGSGDESWRSNPFSISTFFLGRLRPGVAPEQAAAEAESALRASAEEYKELDPSPEVFAASLIPGRGPNQSQAADLSLWLALVAGMVLVIAAANVANLLLARSTARQRELALRSSLGAGRGRLLRQHLTESLLLALLGGAAGLLIAYWGNALVRQFPVPPSAGRLDARMLAFALAVSALTGLLCGLLPALRASRVDPAEGLKEGRTAVSRGRGRTRRALIVLQVAMSLVLLVGAGLFVRSLRAVYAIDPGVDVDALMTVSMNPGRADIPQAERPEMYRAAMERLRQLPGVSRAALVSSSVPLSGGTTGIRFRAEGRDTVGRRDPDFTMVSAGYFETAGTRVIAGRGFTAADATGEPVAVVNSVLAREISPDGNVLGRCIAVWNQVKDGGCTRIIGVVEPTRTRFLEPQDHPQFYLDWDRSDVFRGGRPILLVRLTAESPASAEAIRAAVQGLRPDLRYVQVQPMAEQIRNDLLPYRLGATLFSLFAVLALILAAVGVYGVLAYFVTERTQEIGIRSAIGAPRSAVASVVIRQGMAPVFIGLAIGLGVAVAGSSLIGSLLFGVDARDPLTFTAVAAFLAAVALLATLLPAWRAVRVDPLIALRHE